jgi:hypothetical protein
MNRHLPPNARVLWLWEDRIYSSRHFAWADGVLESFWWLVRWERMDVARFAEDLRSLGVTHLLRNTYREFLYGTTIPATFSRRAQRQRFLQRFFHARDLLAAAERVGILRPIRRGPQWVLYEVRRPPRAAGR